MTKNLSSSSTPVNHSPPQIKSYVKTPNLPLNSASDWNDQTPVPESQTSLWKGIFWFLTFFVGLALIYFCWYFYPHFFKKLINF